MSELAPELTAKVAQDLLAAYGYTVQKKLGQGGCGAAFLIVDKTGATKAIKFCNDDENVRSESTSTRTSKECRKPRCFFGLEKTNNERRVEPSVEC